MGKIAYYKDDYVLAELLLNDFIDKTKDITLVSGAIKQLFDISFQNAEYLKSSQNLEKSKNFNLGRVSMLELKLLEIKTYIKLNDFKTARIKLNEILETKNLPNYIKQNADELIGMI